jgi:acetyltransferase-like isoleucine patch superfamily enzyme
VREATKSIARGLAALAVMPALVSYAIRRQFLGADGALEGSSEALALVPGRVGDYLRRAFLSRVLDACATTATIKFGSLFSQTGARLDENVYVGPRCHLGLVHLERNVLLGAGVHVPSGNATHGIDDVERPIRDQPGTRTVVCIREGSWVGSAAVVMADVGKHCVIGAGSVVTRPIPDYSIAAGIPAKVIRSRRPETPERLTLAGT